MEAKNVKAIREWIAKHRPDVTPMFDRIMRGESEGNDQMRAIFALMAMAFSAGREYQRDNPKDVWP